MSTVQLKRSAVASKVPLTSDLALGELALNTYDGRMFFKKDAGTPAIVTVVTTDDTQTLTNKTASGLTLTGTLTANGSTGSAGQVLTSNSSGVYWSTVSGGGGATNLTLSSNSSTVTVLSDTGTDAVILAANATTAGVLTADTQTIGGVKTLTGTLLNGNTNFDSGSVFVDGTNNLLLVGTTTPYLSRYAGGSAAGATSYAPLQVHTDGAFDTKANFTHWGSGTVGGRVQLGKSKGALGTHTIVAAADLLGELQFLGSDGSEFVMGANIRADVEGTPAANNIAAAITFRTANTGSGSTIFERMRVSSNGNVGIGNTTPADRLSVGGTAYFGANAAFGAAALFVDNTNSRVLIGGNTAYATRHTTTNNGTAVVQINDTGAQKFNALQWSDSINGSRIQLGHSRGATIGTHTALVDGDSLGDYQYVGSDGTSFILSASIQASVDGTPSTNHIPTAISFRNSDAANTISTKVIIAANGNVGIGINSPTSTLHVAGTANISGNITVANTITANGSTGTAGQVLTSSATGVYWSTVSGASGGANLSLTANGSTVSINSDSGTDVVILAANSTTAGVLTAEAQTVGGIKTFANTVVFGGAFDETIFTITDGASVNLSPTNGTIQQWTLGANRTPVAPTNWDAGASMTLMIDDGTARTITWTTMGVKWVGSSSGGGSAPTLATTGWTVIILWKVGTSIYGSLTGYVAT